MTKRTKKKAKTKAPTKPAAHPKWKHAVVYLHAFASRCQCSEGCRNQQLRVLVMCKDWRSRLVSAETPLSFCTEGVRDDNISVIVKMLGWNASLRDENGEARSTWDVRASFIDAIRSMFTITESELVALAKEKGWNGRPLVKLPARTI